MSRTNVWLTLLLLVLSGVGIDQAVAGHYYVHSRKTYGRHGFKAYHYQHDNRRGRSSVIALADAVSDYNLAPSGKLDDMTRKRFHVPVSAVQADQVRLERIGLTLLNTGQAIFTGTLQHDGGPDGSLQGNHVVVRVRAYSGVPRDPYLLDALMVWETSYDTWVTRNRPQVIRFGTGEKGDPTLQRFFPQITHLELEVEYVASR